MKPIKAKVLLQKFEERCLKRRPSYNSDHDFIYGAATMLEFLKQEGVITKGQCTYLGVQLTELVFRIAAKREEEKVAMIV